MQAKMSFKLFGENLYTWYYVIVCMSCYAVGEIGHFLIGIVSRPIAQDIGFGDQGCISNNTLIEDKAPEQCSGMNVTKCTSLEFENTTYCEWNYLGSGIQYQLLAGPCFIGVFTVMGILLGVIGDVYNRVRILSASVCFYSLMAFLTGYSAQYWQLVLLRFGFGAGEAACTPLTASIVADKFGDQSRALAMSMFNWGIYIGYGLAFTIGNYVPQANILGQGWRWAYFLTGIPGLFFAVLLFMTVKEPVRKSISSADKEVKTEKKIDIPPEILDLTGSPPSLEPLVSSEIKIQSADKRSSPIATLRLAFQTFATSPALLMLLLAACIRHTASFCWAYNTQLYFNEYFPGTDLGFWMTLCSIVGGLIGIASGGIISDRIVSRHGISARLWVLVVSQSIAAPLAALVLYLSPPYCFAALLSAYLFAEMWFGVLFTVLVERLSVEVRSSGISLFIFVMNNVASAGQLTVPALKSLVGFRTALYITYAGFYGLTEMWFGVVMTVFVEKAPTRIRATVVAMAAFVISNVGGNLPIVVASLKHSVGGLRNALYIMYSGMYLLSALFFLFAQLLMKREATRKSSPAIESTSD